MNQQGMEVFHRNNAVCRKDLDLISNGNFKVLEHKEFYTLKFFKVNGMTKFWGEKKDANRNNFMGDILSSIYGNGIPVSYIILGNDLGIEVLIGAAEFLVPGLKSLLEALYIGIDIEIVEDVGTGLSELLYGGFFTGIPTNKTMDQKSYSQVDSICRAMLGKKFCYMVLAKGIHPMVTAFAHERLFAEMESVYSVINSSVSGGVLGNITAQTQDFQGKNYFDNLGFLEKNLNIGSKVGMWEVSGYFASDDKADARKLGNTLKAVYLGEESLPEKFRTIEYNDISQVIQRFLTMEDLSNNLHPLNTWNEPSTSGTVSLYKHRYKTILNSVQLGCLCELPKSEFQGYYLDEYVEFDLDARSRRNIIDKINIGEVCISDKQTETTNTNHYFFDKNDLTRHALIIGVTGGGKTNTSKSLLYNLWMDRETGSKIPFLVIESAKREYWELRNIPGFEDLKLFTLGSETPGESIKYRINPFEVQKGISLQTHIDYLLSTFKAAFELYPPMPYVLETAVYEVYEDRGWDIVQNKNRYGFERFPMLSDLYHKIGVIVERMGYHQELKSNIQAALEARIYSLMIGGKGTMLNTPKSIPIQNLLSSPVVMELEDIGDDETKAFVIGILLVQLYEYRKSVSFETDGRLSHVLLVEEAHRLLKRVESKGEGSSTQAKSVEFFCHLLAEIRTFGQGIIIADQIPSKLAQDTIKNTNLKIIHRTVDKEDRELIGNSMNMSEKQIGYLSSLKRGYAAVYSEGDNRPKYVKIPFLGSVKKDNRRQVIELIGEDVNRCWNIEDLQVDNHPGCTYCENQCAYYNEVVELVKNHIDYEKVLEEWKREFYSSVEISEFIRFMESESYVFTNVFQKICLVGVILSLGNGDLSKGDVKDILAKYIRYQYSLGMRKLNN